MKLTCCRSSALQPLAFSLQPSPTIAANHRPSGIGYLVSVLIACLCLLTTGCLTRPALTVQTFDFTAPETNTAAASAAQAQGPVLAIRTLKIMPPYDGCSFVYRTGESSYVRDPYAEFISAPAQLLAPQIGQLLVQDGHFSSIVRPTGGVKPDQLAEITVSQLYGDFRDRAHPQAILTLRFTLLSATNGMTGQVLFQKAYTRSLPMDSASPVALIHAWNQALTEITTEISSDLPRE